MSKSLISFIVVLAAGAVAVWYFLIRPKTLETPTAGAEEPDVVNHFVVGEIDTPPSISHIGEQVVPVERVHTAVQPMLGDVTSSPIVISGSTLVAKDGVVEAENGYYAGGKVELDKIGDNLVPVVRTETGATVGLATDPILVNLNRDAFGRFVYSGTDAEIAAQKAAAVEFQSSLHDPDIQSSIPGVYTYGDARLWNGANANNGVYQNYYGEIPFTAEYQSLMASGSATQTQIDALKAKSRAAMASVLKTKARATPTELNYWGVA